MMKKAIPRDVPVGQIQWHCSEDSGGPDVGILLRLTETQYLWAGEITRADWEDAGPEAAELGPDFGWWLIFYNGKEKTVLGRCVGRYQTQDIFEHIAAAILRKSPK